MHPFLATAVVLRNTFRPRLCFKIHIEQLSSFTQLPWFKCAHIKCMQENLIVYETNLVSCSVMASKHHSAERFVYLWSILVLHH